MAVELDENPLINQSGARSLSIYSENDVPNECGITASLNLQAGNSSPSLQQQSDRLLKSWEMNYHEAAIFLQEGEDNDKFNTHPRNQDALPAYLIVHNYWFYTMDLLAALLLMFLAAFEKPSVNVFDVPIGVHGTLELLALFVVGIELGMKMRWLGIKTFLQHKRTMIIAVTLIIMFIEAIVVLIRQTNHFRVTRALRPIFLIDTHYCGGVRRFIRQILQSLPPIVDMLVLLLFFMLVFSTLGFYLFRDNPKDPYFATLQDSFVSLFVLLTTANFPDVMMPAYNNCRWSFIFFVAYLSIELYFLMNLMLAVVYDTFTTIEKDKFRKLLLHKRQGSQLAFKMLVNRQMPDKVSFKHYEGLMKFYKPKMKRRDVYLTFKTLNTTGSGFLNLEEFYDIYSLSKLKWKALKGDIPCYSKLCFPFSLLVQGINWLVNWNWFNYFIYLTIAVNGLWLLIETGQVSNNPDRKGLSFHTTWNSIIFASIYVIEMLLKLTGFGLRKYFSNGWNVFDFCVTFVTSVGVLMEYIHHTFYYIIILRPLRLLSLFRMKRRYRDVLGTLLILVPRMLSVAVVLIVIYYFFAIIGIELFSDFDMKNCCKNSTVEEFYRFENSSTFPAYYYLNNFENIFSSGVLLFELTVVNNWFITMEGYAIVASNWSRIYFMVFYIVAMVVMTIVVAFILEAFLFRIQYRREMSSGDMEAHSKIRFETILTREELEMCYNKSKDVSEIRSYLIDVDTRDTVTYRGVRLSSKEDFCLNMYKKEVEVWLNHRKLPSKLTINI